jgi:hypothetical protein
LDVTQPAEEPEKHGAGRVRVHTSAKADSTTLGSLDELLGFLQDLRDLE